MIWKLGENVSKIGLQMDRSIKDKKKRKIWVKSRKLINLFAKLMFRAFVFLLGFQNISEVWTGSMLVMKGCSSSSATVYLSLGSFFKQIRMNSLASLLMGVAFENLISSSTILMKSRSLLISKGTLPNNS